MAGLTGRGSRPMLIATGRSVRRGIDALIPSRRYPVAELVPASEPAPPGSALSPDPELTWRPGPRRTQPEEVGPVWRQMEPAHVVLAMIAFVIVIMAILIAVLVSGL